jgi:hypothetical protein
MASRAACSPERCLLDPRVAGSSAYFVFCMSLTPGTYFLSGAIAHAETRDTNQFLDYRFDALQLQVVGQPRCFSTSLSGSRR